MKINFGTILLIGATVYLLTRPQTATPVVTDPITDGPIPDEPLANAVDIYVTDENTGQQVYHHTEVLNADGGTDIYLLDAATGEYVYVKPKQVKPKQTAGGAVNGIRGLKRTRSINRQSAMI